MTTYNSERFVAEQLESFLGQERLPDELVVSDDASTDHTIEIIRDFHNRAPFSVRVLVNGQNLGTRGNFERAIAECSGEIIFLSDADDYWYPQKIFRIVKALDAAPKAGLAVCNADLVGEHLEPLGTTAWERIDRFFPSRRLLEKIAQGKDYRCYMPTGGCCMAFRAKFKPLILPMTSPYDKFIACTIVCSGAGGAVLLSEPLMAYRRHRSQVTFRDPVSSFTRVLTRLSAHHEPPNALPQLVERLERNPATRFSMNPGIRLSALRHWRARINMPSSLPGRLRVVSRELLARRYHRFSGGFVTAGKDLFFARQKNENPAPDEVPA